MVGNATHSMIFDIFGTKKKREKWDRWNWVVSNSPFHFFEYKYNAMEVYKAGKTFYFVLQT